MYGNNNNAYKVILHPIYADPTSFEQDVTVDASFNNYGTFKKVDIEFEVRQGIEW